MQSQYPLPSLSIHCNQDNGCTGRTYRCIVMPQLRKSFTRRTLLMTSRPRLSKTSTFHIGSPSAFNIGVDLGVMPFDAVVSAVTSESSAAWLRFSKRSMETGHVSPRRARGTGGITDLLGDRGGIGTKTFWGVAAGQPYGTQRIRTAARGQAGSGVSRWRRMRRWRVPGYGGREREWGRCSHSQAAQVALFLDTCTIVPAARLA